MRYLRVDDSEKIAEREIVSRVFLVRCNRTSARPVRAWFRLAL